MTVRRPTSEQQRAVTQLRALAALHRFRVVVAAEGFPILPGRFGRIEWYCDGVNCWSCALLRQLALAVHTDHLRVFQKLWAIPGLMRHQSGDAEMRAVFAVELLAKVAAGHESVATTEIYTHVTAARRRRVVQLLEGPGEIRSPSVSPA